jgi:hypothetical protein
LISGLLDPGTDLGPHLGDDGGQRVAIVRDGLSALALDICDASYIMYHN